RSRSISTTRLWGERRWSSPWRDSPGETIDMAVTREDVKHVAALARLSMTDERAAEFTAQLNTILGHMDVLARVDTKKMEPVVGVGAESAPLQRDQAPSVRLERPID